MPITFPAPPHTVPPGQMVLWALPTAVTGVLGNNTTNSLSYNLNGAVLSQWQSSTLGGTFSNATWSNFAVNVPFSSTIQSIYRVTVATCISIFNTACGFDFSINLQNAGNVPATEYHDNSSIGNTMATVTSTSIQAYQSATIFAGPWTPPDVLNVSFVGLAVYATLPTYQVRTSINIGNTYRYPSR